MKQLVRALVTAGLVIGALAVASPASAAYSSPRFWVDMPTERQSTGAPFRINFRAAIEDDATFRVQIYVPQGYVTSLVPQAGQNIGTAAAVINATAIAAEAQVPVTGNIVGDTYAPDRYPQGAACTGSPQIAGVWLLQLTAAGQTLTVPMYVETITAGPLADRFSGRLTACLPSPYPEAGPARAQLGAKLLSASLSIRNVFTNPTAGGAYRWSALMTPWTPNSGVPNPTGTVEVQSIDRLPAQVVLTAAPNHRRNTVTFRGRVSENRVAVAGAAVQILRGVRVIRTVRTNARGNFATTVRLRPGRYTFRARAIVAVRNVDDCVQQFAPVPCIRATASGYRLLNNRAIRLRLR